jgi:hypothetical protein
MVYALQKFLHYLLGGHFKMFIDHSRVEIPSKKAIVLGVIHKFGHCDDVMMMS